MKHLIVVAHPAEGSFTMGLARAYAAELLPASVTHPAGADVARAQEEVRTA
jgi:putative NADPH-quinone reductase